jgi:4a-hydroxytetrahydrobiopterin dehydratase
VIQNPKNGASMSTSETQTLSQRKCQACEGGVEKLSAEQCVPLRIQVPKWQANDSSDWIERKWVFKNFVEAISFINRVGEVAEAEQHHPDLHLTGYRNVKVVLTTHAIGGLSENDFIVAAKIDAMFP